MPSGKKQFGKVECKEILFRIFEFAKSLHRFTTFALKHFRFLSFPLASNTELAAVFRLLFQYSSSSHCFNTIRKVSSLRAKRAAFFYPYVTASADLVVFLNVPRNIVFLRNLLKHCAEFHMDLKSGRFEHTVTTSI